MMALATRYDVSAQVDSSIVADRLPAMCGSETFTTVVSSTSMKVANITAMAMIQGLTGLGGSGVMVQGSPEPISYTPSPSQTCPASVDDPDLRPARKSTSPAGAAPL